MTEREVARLFHAFNARYFGNRLPPYRVLFRWNRAGPDVVEEGCCYRKRRLILLCPGMRRSRREVSFMLLHEMVHAATGDYHGGRFWREFKRLAEEGAPLGRGFKVHTQHLPTRELTRSHRRGTGKGGK